MEQTRIIDNLETGQSQAIISTRGYSPRIIPEDRKALLVARDPISDIAIFAATDSVGIDDPSGSLTLSQLHAHEINSGVWPVQAWTVAYCGDEDPPRFTQLQAEYMQALNHSQGLSTGDLTSQMLPSFTFLFSPNRKAMAVGEVRKPGKAQQTPYINNRPPNFDSGEHTISGYFGCSGAMIATFREAKLDDPVVIGIFRGEFRHSPFNEHVAFTRQGIDWIKDKISGIKEAAQTQHDSDTVMGSSPFGN